MIKDLYSQMLRYNFKPKHDLDQYFIIDDKVIATVVNELGLEKTDVVLEIGPGTGFLSKQILKKSKMVIAIEKDKKMVEILEKEFKKEINSNNLVLINSDFLEIDLRKLAYTKLATFLPYSISQEFIEKIAGEKKEMVLVVQKEFAEKLASSPGFSNYTAVSSLCQSYFTVRVVRTIGRGSFFPAPPCESAIVKLTPNNKEKDENYKKFVLELFRYPNKDVSSAVKLIYRGIAPKGLPKKKVRQLDIKDIENVYKVVA